jgi:hypothetical protein
VITQKNNKDVINSRLNLVMCLECGKDYVPELIISTVDPPEGINIIGPPRYIEARIVKNKKNLKGEQHAI